MALNSEHRKALEGAAERLETALPRVRALVAALEAWRWEVRTRAVATQLRQLAREDAVLRETVARAARRLRAEAWPPGEVRALIEEVQTQLAQLDVALVNRGFPDLATLRGALTVRPRAVPLEERDEAAAEVLDPEEPEVVLLARFGAALEAVVGRPVERSKPLPFTLAQLEALLGVWKEGRAALLGAWARVAAVDTTGGVERALRRRAQLAPKGARGHAGPRVLVHAEHWSAAATARLEQLLAERFSPVRLTPDERDDGLRYLLSRERDGAARLRRESPRSELLMLAHELTAIPEGRAPLTGGSAQVLRWAQQADALESDEDWRRLRDALKALTARSFGRPVAPLYRVGQPPHVVNSPTRLADFFTVSRQT
jgi:hypothetical protein